MDFEFCLTLTILSDLLEDCHLVSKNLQNPKLNIAAAADQVSALIKTTVYRKEQKNISTCTVKVQRTKLNQLVWNIQNHEAVKFQGELMTIGRLKPAQQDNQD